MLRTSARQADSSGRKHHNGSAQANDNSYLGQFAFTRESLFSATILFQFSARLARPRHGLVRSGSGLVGNAISEGELLPHTALVATL